MSPQNDWTANQVKEYVTHIIYELDKRYDQRFKALDEAARVALDAAKTNSSRFTAILALLISLGSLIVAMRVI